MRGLFNYCREYLKADQNVKALLSLVFVSILGVFLWSLLNLEHLSTSYSFSQYLPAQHPLLTQQALAKKQFQTESQNPFLLVLTRDESWLSPKAMTQIKKISLSLGQLKGVKQVTGLATVEGAIEQKGQITVGPIFESLPANLWQSYVERHDLLSEQLISKDLRSVVLLVETESLSINQLAKLGQGIKSLAKDQMPGARIRLGGGPEFQIRFTKLLQSDLSLFAILSFVLFSSMFFALFQGLSALALTVFSLIFTNTLCLAVMAHLGIPIDILLSTLPIVVSVAVLSVMIHTFHRWAELCRKPITWQERFWTAVQVLKEMFRGNFLGSMTTALGFFVLVNTSVPGIRQYGLTITVAVLLSWLSSQIILLLALHLTQPTMRTWCHRSAGWMIYLTRHAKLVVSGALVLVLACLLAIPYLHFGNRVFDDLSPSEPARKVTEFVDKNFGGNISYDLTVIAKTKNYWKKIEQLNRLKVLMSTWKTNANLGSVLALPSLMSGNMLKQDSEVAETLFLYSMSSADPTRSFISEDGKQLLLRFRFFDRDSLLIQQDFAKFKRDLKIAFPQVSLKESGLGQLTHSINSEVAKDLVFGFWQSLVFIGLFLLLVFRSWRYALISCLPNLLPPLILLGVMSLLHTSIKPGIGMIFSITLGIAFNNTVYLLSRLKAQKVRFSLALKKTVLQEGNPCLFETIVMASGFALFLFSRFQLNQTFGAYMILAILAGAFGDLCLLPSLLKLWGPTIFTKPETASEAGLSNTSEQTPSWSVAAVLALVIAFACSISQPTLAKNDDSAALLARVRDHISAHDEQAEVEMVIQEANGSKKVRKLRLLTLNQNKFYAKAQVLSPSDIKGMALLSEVDQGEESQWLYTPSNKQVRRLMSVKKSNGVLGSELSLEDLNSAAIKGLRTKLIQTNQNQTLIALYLKPGTSLYDKVLLTIATKEELPIKTEYFKKSKLIKLVEFRDYKKFEQIFRAQHIRVKNLLNHRGTDLNLLSYQANPGLQVSDFTPSRLKDN